MLRLVILGFSFSGIFTAKIGSGRCPILPEQADFDFQKFKGLWHAIKWTNFEDGGSSAACETVKYSERNDGNVKLVFHYKSSQGVAVHDEETGEWIHSKNMMKVRKDIYSTGYNHWIYPYQNYTLAILVSCSEALENYHLQRVWLASRETKVDQESIEELREELSKMGLGSHRLIDVDNNQCSETLLSDEDENTEANAVKDSTSSTSPEIRNDATNEGSEENKDADKVILRSNQLSQNDGVRSGSNNYGNIQFSQDFGKVGTGTGQEKSQYNIREYENMMEMPKSQQYENYGNTNYGNSQVRETRSNGYESQVMPMAENARMANDNTNGKMANGGQSSALSQENIDYYNYFMQQEYYNRLYALYLQNQQNQQSTQQPRTKEEIEEMKRALREKERQEREKAERQNRERERARRQRIQAMNRHVHYHRH